MNEFQHFKWILYMLDETVQIIASCEGCLLKAGTIKEPFMATEIQGGILKEYLTEDDYLAPYQVNNQITQECGSFMFLYKLSHLHNNYSWYLPAY